MGRMAVRGWPHIFGAVIGEPDRIILLDSHIGRTITIVGIANVIRFRGCLSAASTRTGRCG